MPSPLCDDCQASGLPILTVRYAVVPSALSAALPAWVGGQRVTSVPLGGEFSYALRTLRAGYVYLFYSKNRFGSNKWECYMVTADGLLVKQPDPLMAAPVPAPTLSCSTQGHNNSRLRHLIIERPDKCGPTWIAFSPHKWSKETLDEYTASSQLRNARMQTIHPAEMAKGAKHGHGIPADAAALEQVLEYAPSLDTTKLPYSGAISAFSKEDGSFDPARVSQVSTLYPWHLRRGQAQDDLHAMQLRAKKTDGVSNTPHLLALWDTIGIAHELNGFRNDAAGWIDLFGREREFELSAANTLDGLRDALVNKAGNAAQAQQDQTLQQASSWYSSQDAAQQRANAQKLPEPQRTRQLEVCDIVDDWAHRQVPITLGHQGRLNAANTLPEPQRSQEVARIKADVDRFTLSRANNHKAHVARARAEAWSKYESCLDRRTLDKFQKSRQRLADAADTVIDRRTEALVAWLRAPLFIDTLEDFHPTSIVDGVLFDDVVSGAAFGIGTTARGAQLIDEWAEQARASVKTNLLWRVIALNQQEGIAALDAALDEAKKHHVQQTLSSTLTWAGYTAKVMKGLADTYKKAQGVYDANTKATSPAGSTVFGARINPINMRGFDAAAITFGDRVFKSFAIDKLGDYASEKIIQHIFCIRALVNPLDSVRLIEEQAKAAQLAREQTLRRVDATRAFMRLDTPEIKTAQTEALKKAWADFTAGTDQVKAGQAIKDARLAVVVGLIEGVNFMKLIADCKRKGDGKSYFSLLASGMTIASALFDVAATVVKNLPTTPTTALPALGAESWTYQTLKGWGGALSGMASFIGGGLDLMEAGKADTKGYGTLYALYMGKGYATIFSGALTFAVTFTYAAPLVSRWTGLAAGGAIIKQVGAKAAAVIGFRILGMAVGGWITVGTLAVQVIIWQVTPDALEDWVSHCAFGKKKTTGGYKSVKEQEDKLGEALVEMGLQ